MSEERDPSLRLVAVDVGDRMKPLLETMQAIGDAMGMLLGSFSVSHITQRQEDRDQVFIALACPSVKAATGAASTLVTVALVDPAVREALREAGQPAAVTASGVTMLYFENLKGEPVDEGETQ